MIYNLSIISLWAMKYLQNDIKFMLQWSIAKWECGPSNRYIL